MQQGILLNICRPVKSDYMRLLFLLAVCCCCSCSHSKKITVAANGPQFSRRDAETSLTAAVQQYKKLADLLPEGQFARTFENGRLRSVNASGWVSGFYPGTLLLLSRFSKDTALLQEAKKRLRVLQKEQYNTHTHDLGFMMYNSFGNVNAVAPDTSCRRILINSAQSLAKRFSPAVGCIRSWDSDSTHFLVIIDNMMNLELLMYAFKETRDSAFYHIAVTHANTTLRNHFRDDYSAYHVVDYNPQTGAVQKKHTHQGAADESAWARGQAWALYGFTMMYRETRNEKYLAQANHIAQFIIHHPNLPADKIPYWDFNAPGIPNAWRDASAAAIISSALLELGQYAAADKKKHYRNTAVQMLAALSGPVYRTVGNEAGGFLLKHSVGHLPAGNEIDTPLSYADYYYVEALLRFIGGIQD